MKVYLSSSDYGIYDANKERLFSGDQEIEMSEKEFEEYQNAVKQYYSWQTFFDDKLRVSWYDEMKQRKPDHSVPF